MVIWWNKSVQINIFCDGIFLSTFPLWVKEKNEERKISNNCCKNIDKIVKSFLEINHTVRSPKMS